jgi:5-methylcytosine-specific restriction endonuclease McrA
VTIREHTKRQRAEVAKPRPAQAAARPPKGRTIPASVRREIFARDEGRCTFIGENGRRCGATRMLELHHRLPYAKGGAATVEGLTVHCKAHNDLEARRVFGDQVMDRFTRRGRSP